METISRAVPAFVYGRMFSDMRRRLWVASEVGEMPDMDGYLPCEMWAYMGIDDSCAPDASVTGEAARCATGGRILIGAAWRATMRRDIGSRYPRLHVPGWTNIGTAK